MQVAMALAVAMLVAWLRRPPTRIFLRQFHALPQRLREDLTNNRSSSSINNNSNPCHFSDHRISNSMKRFENSLFLFLIFVVFFFVCCFFLFFFVCHQCCRSISIFCVCLCVCECTMSFPRGNRYDKRLLASTSFRFTSFHFVSLVLSFSPGLFVNQQYTL